MAIKIFPENETPQIQNHMDEPVAGEINNRIASGSPKRLTNAGAHHMLKPLDRAILGIESEFEEEVGLHQTFGGD